MEWDTYYVSYSSNTTRKIHEIQINYIYSQNTFSTSDNHTIDVKVGIDLYSSGYTPSEEILEGSTQDTWKIQDETWDPPSCSSSFSLTP